MQRRTKRQLERFFLLTGTGCVLIWLVSIAGPAVYQDWGNWSFDQKLRGEDPTLTGYLVAKKNLIIADLGPSHPKPPAQPEASNTPPHLPPTQAQKTGSVLGRLEIPRLHLSSMVREGAGETTLAIALGHIPGTAIPGQNGNVGVAGHRDKLFRGLKDIKSNDLVKFETLSGTYTYRVETTNIVTPRDVGVLKPGQNPELTLVTCYPFYYVGSAPQRFIVKARQVIDAPETVSAFHEVSKSIPPKKAAPPKVIAQVLPRKPSAPRTIFSVSTNHTQQLAPGVLIGLRETDVRSHRLTGWVWLSGEHRTIWIHDRTPLRIYGALDRRTRVLVITGINRGSIVGYLAPSTT